MNKTIFSMLLTALIPLVVNGANQGVSTQVPNLPGETPSVAARPDSDATAATDENLAAHGHRSAPYWQALTHQPSFNASTALLLTDGTVICQEYESSNWYKLTPDLHGSYVNGTWSQIAPLPAGYGPLYYASAVLADGRVLVFGGEYNVSSASTDRGAIYDPVANTWTDLPPPSGWGYIGDASSAVLTNGKFLLADPYGNNLAILDPSTLSWTASNAYKNETNGEQGWTLLPDGSVLTVDLIHGSYKSDAWRYIPSIDNWISAGDPPVVLANNNEIGPPILRPNGTVFYPGACPVPATGFVFPCLSAAHTATYTPPTQLFGNGTWTAGPDIPDGLDVADAPASILPSGNVLLMTSPGWLQTGAVFFEFDGEKLNPAPAPPRAPLDSSYYGRMLLLPSGQVLFTDYSTDIEIYTPNGTYERAWAPTITHAPRRVQAGSTYSISGTQFNGLSQGASYGDDAQMASNYPLVRVTNAATGHVAYWRTHDHSTMAVATGSAIVSTRFDVPPEAEHGISFLVVVANGIPSEPAVVVVAAGPGQ